MENSATPIPQQTPSSPAAPARSNWAGIIFAILFVLGLGSTAYLYDQNQQLKKVISTYEQSQQPQTIIPTETPDTSTTPGSDDPVLQKFIQSGCISYFDGCNSCTIDSSGRTECTAMACEVTGEPKCLKYK
jgi:hypothetical protein